MTLVCEDDRQIGEHKVILPASPPSPVMKMNGDGMGDGDEVMISYFCPSLGNIINYVEYEQNKLNLVKAR